MQTNRLISDSERFKEAWKIYEASFPSDERRKLVDQIKLFHNPKYNFSIAINDNSNVGFIAFWDFTEFTFIEHIAIREDLKNKGLGTKLLRTHLPSNKKTVLEVERPEKGEIAKKRIAFYERLGFQLNHYNYIQPPYSKDKNPVPLYLMSHPNPLTAVDFLKIRYQLHTTVYALKIPLIK